MKNFVLIFVSLFVLALVGCAPQVDVAAEEAAIRTALGEAWNAVATKDVDKFVSLCADEDRMFPPGAPMVRGKQEIREYMSQLFAMPGFAMSQQPPQVEVSRGGDLAYTTDTFELTLQNAKGNSLTQPGKHVVVWKKQADSSWKIILDIWNLDQPAGGE